MKFHKKHLPAFTILELVLNITIMSIITSSIYVAFNFFTEQLHHYTKNKEQTTELLQSYSVLEQDFFYCKNYRTLGRALIINTIDNKTITYNIDDDFIFREINNTVEKLPIKTTTSHFITKTNKGLHCLFIELTVFNQTIPCVFINQQGISHTINKKL